jgi:DNA primase large subunit
MDEIISKSRQKDHVSHFLMRLAYCRTEEYRRWFIAQETDLFRFRFSMESSEDIRAFMKENKMNFLPVCRDIANIHQIITYLIIFHQTFYRFQRKKKRRY